MHPLTGNDDEKRNKKSKYLHYSFGDLEQQRYKE
jgi:hypothetical protein